MVVSSKICNLKCGVVPFVLATALAPAHAIAQDWRERMRAPTELRSTLPASGPVEPVALELRGGVRLGHTSNADADFEEAGSPFLRVEQEMALRRVVGQTEVGLTLRGTITRAERTDAVEFAETEARAGVAHTFANGASISAEAGYLFEDDRGFRSHDTGLALEASWDLRGMSPFLTGTLNDISHDDIEILPGLVDTGDNDRLRLGLEVGIEMPLGEGLRGSVSIGHLDQRYRRDADLAGISRSSRSLYVRAGVAFETDAISGEVAAMALKRDYDEPLYPDTSVLLAEAALSWRPDDETLIMLRYFGDLEETPVYGARNVLKHSAILSAVRDVGAGFTTTGAVYVDRERYLDTDRTDTTVGGGLELAYALDAATSLDIALQYERLSSTLLVDPVEVWKVSTGISYALAN